MPRITNSLVSRLIRESSDRSAHHALWDKVVEIADDHFGVGELVTTLAQVYNGGFQQLVDNGYLQELTIATRFLSKLKSPQAANLRNLLAGIEPDVRHYEHEMSRHSHSEEDSESGDEVAEELDRAVEPVERWIYADENIDPILQEILERFAPSNT